MTPGGLFPDDAFKNENADEPWTKGNTDRMLELYLAGAAIPRIAQAMKRNPKAIRRQLECFTYNERDRAINYQPTEIRTSRKGKRISQNEELLIREHWERKVPVEVTARLLMRDPNEIRHDVESETRHAAVAEVGPNIDLVLAYRYCYYVKKVSIVTDQAYDVIEKEAIEFGGGYAALDKPGSDNPETYPPHIRALGMYLIFKFAKKETK